jgi:hypothetical protein
MDKNKDRAKEISSYLQKNTTMRFRHRYGRKNKAKRIFQWWKNESRTAK